MSRFMAINLPPRVKVKADDDDVVLMSDESGSGSSRKREFGLVEQEDTKKEGEASGYSGGVKSKITKIDNEIEHEHDRKEEEAVDEVLLEIAPKVFLNGIIMKEIVTYLPSASLLNLRSTCKLWNKLMLPPSRSNNHKYLKINADNLHLVTQQIKCSPGGIPFCSFAFEPEQFPEPTSSAELQELIGLIAPIITHLKLTLKDSADQLHHFATAFPAIKHLSIIMTGQTVFSEIWTLWPNIEYLNVKINQVEKEPLYYESWLTGISFINLALMRIRANEGIPIRDNTKSLSFVPRDPGFTDLKYLREFNLQLYSHLYAYIRPSMTSWTPNADGSRTPMFISDLSGYFAFAASPSKQLRRISVNNCAHFSEDCIATVQAALGVNGEFIRPIPPPPSPPIKDYSNLKFIPDWDLIVPPPNPPQ